jgi:UTP--glucose-1-phosphate uridylyltransferase
VISDRRIAAAVIPAAGLGLRMRSFTGGVIPKEMLSTPRGPVIRSILEELTASGIQKVVIVFRPGQDLLRTYLTEDLASDTVELVFVPQARNASGNGGAILSAADALGHSEFIVVWGDEIFLGTRPRAKELIDASARREASVPTIALTAVTEADVAKCGIAKLGEWVSASEVWVTDVVEKPQPHLAPSTYASVGGCVMTAGLLETLRASRPRHDGEVYLSTAISSFATSQLVLGCVVSASWCETGSPDGFVRTVAAMLRS